MTPSLPHERILVCVGPAPSSENLVRAAARMADARQASWTAAYVEPSLGVNAGDRARLESHLRVAESLGGNVTRLSGTRVAETLLDYARQHGVTRIVIGKATHARVLDRLRGSLLDDVVRASQDIDVQVISGDSGGVRARPRSPSRSRLAPERFFAAVLIVLITSALAGALRSSLGIPDVEGLYFVAVMIAALRFGSGPSVLAAALGVLAYDFLFVPPQFTFHVTDPRYLLTFALMFAAGLIVSQLSARVRRQEHEARAREKRATALAKLARDLGAAHDAASIAEVVVRHAAEAFGAHALLECPSTTDTPRVTASAGRSAVAAASTVDALSAPLVVADRELGVLRVELAPSAVPRAEQHELLDALARQAALALERARLAQEARALALRAEAEQVRASLLSAVSHDLRTPLASITGAASSMRDDARLSEATRADLLESICEEAERLDRLVANLLDMTRIESGGVVLKREWIPLEEMIGSAFTRLEGQLVGRPITVSLSSDVPLLFVDPLLFEQVFVNLLENAAKYTPAEGAIEVVAALDGADLGISVLDRGPGVPTGSEQRLFEKFYRGSHVGIRGIGLGLAICRWIVEAHGGSIAAGNREGGGASFRMLLPLGPPPPTLDDQTGNQA